MQPELPQTELEGRLALVSLLQELTVLVMRLFHPEQPVNRLAERLTERLDAVVTLLLQVDAKDERIQTVLLGSAGLSRRSRALAIRDSSAFSWETCELPFPELAPPDLTRLVIPLPDAPGDPLRYAILIYFRGEARIGREVVAMLTRLAASLRMALDHRNLYARSLEHERALVAEIEERQRAEETIRSLNRELEERVRQRTHELVSANRELRDSLGRLHEAQGKLLEAAKAAAVGSFIAGLSHELNNPLAVILGYVQTLLRHHQLDPLTRSALTAVEQHARRCARLVRSLLVFSSTKVSVIRPAAMAPLIERAVAVAAPQADQRRVELRIEPVPPLPWVPLSADRMESALLNLISNALDASPAGSTVTVEARLLERAGAAGVEVSVRDQGPGISPATLPHVFDPFYTTKPGSLGRGFGLPLARRIVDEHRGHIDIQTVLGAGTRVGIWLPLSETATEQRATEGR